jgi:hypothetical protein
MSNNGYEVKSKPQYVAYSPEVALIVGSGFTPEEQSLIDKKLQEYKLKQAGAEKEARYCVEVLFSKHYSAHKVSAGMIICMENGALRGAGQGSVHFCPRKECGKPIPQNMVGADNVLCPSCMHIHRGSELEGEILARLSLQRWSQAIVNKIMKLDMSADVRVVYSFEDVRSATAREQDKYRAGEHLGSVRRGRAVRTYLLHDIVVDTTHCADLVSRIKAFLEA